jgi:hypothetical protein
MPQNGYSIGRDVTLNIITAAGALTISGLTSFQSRQESNEEKILRIDGVIDHVRYFTGWAGRFGIERRDPTLDRYFNQLEANFYAGVADGPVSITETILEQSGGISTYRYQGVLLKFDNAGEWRGDTSVKLDMSFIARRRITLS